MSLTALCVCGTLLAFSGLPWTAADSDEGDPLGDHGSGPCAATLRPGGPCRRGQDESTCPYLFSLPPLTVHLPKQFRELEQILKDVQKLKDNVDQLRKMCADCTVSQTGRECGRQKESENENLNERADRHRDEREWLNERNARRLNDFSQECGTNRVKVEKTTGADGDTDSEKRANLEVKERNKWEAESESNKGVVKENEKEALTEVAEKDGKFQAEGAKGKDELGQEKMPAAGENDRMVVDRVRKRVVIKDNRETATGINEEKHGGGNSEGDGDDILEKGKGGTFSSNIKIKEKNEESDMWRDETKETKKKTHTEGDRGSDGIKMSEDRDEHTNKEQEQHREERKRKMEKGIKVEQNNKKLKQTESIVRAEKETIKEGEVGEEETGKEIKTEREKMVQSLQRDSDGELTSSQAIEGTDFVSISPTPHSTTGSAQWHDFTHSNEAIAFTSSFPSPSTADVNQEMTITADRLPTQSTGPGAAGIYAHPSPVAEEGFRTTSMPTTTATLSMLGGPEQQIASVTTGFTSTTSSRPDAGFQGRVISTTTTATSRQYLYATTFPGAISSNTKTDVKPHPGRGPNPGEKHKPAIKPEADRTLKDPENYNKPDQAPRPDKTTKHDQKQKPSRSKPTTDQKSKPGEDPKQVQIRKPNQRPLPDNLPTDENLNNIQISTHGQEHTTDPNQLPIQNTKSFPKSILPVQRPTARQTVNSKTGSDKDPLTDQDPESVEINHNSKPEKRPLHPLKTNRSDQKKKSPKFQKSQEKLRPDQSSTLNQYFTPVQEPEPERSETTSLPPKPHQTPVTESTEHSDEYPLIEDRKSVQGSTPGPTSDQKPKPSQEIPQGNQKPKLGQPRPNQKHPELITDQKTQPNVKLDPQTNQGLKTPQLDQMPSLNPRPLADEIPEAESNKASQTSAPPRRRPPTRPTAKSGATPAQRPKPAVQLKPSPKTKTDLDLSENGRPTSDSIQSSRTDMTSASGPVKLVSDVTRSPEDVEFSSSKMKTIFSSLVTGPFPHLHPLSDGFTMSPNSRITSDLRPQTADQPPSIPVTRRPNKIIPSVIQSTSPGSAKPNQASKTDSSLQVKIFHNVEITAPIEAPDPNKMMVSVLSPSAQTTSTTSPDLRSTTPATSGPEPEVAGVESSTPSARELRVKINQVAAFFNDSLSPNGRSPVRRPQEHPEDHQGGGRPDRRLPTLIPSKVSMARRDCSAHLLRGKTHSGVYVVTPDLRSRSFPVFCDMELDGGGWTLLQRRQDGSVSFNRSWAEYRSGFGELDGGEFWLGNSLIHLLTRGGDMMLRVELEDHDGVMEHAEYAQFRVASERLSYRLTVGGYSGTAGDALRFGKSYDHNNRAFTTPDRDNDRYPSGNCGAYYSSGWWFDACMAANLNGKYYVGKYKGVRDGIFWGTWHNISAEYYPTNDRQSFKKVRMMIRPKGFAP